MPKAPDAKDFAPNDPLLCGACGTKEATHEIGISVHRGLDYAASKRLYSVHYAVCPDCVRDVVTVKLGAELKAAKRRA